MPFEKLTKNKKHSCEPFPSWTQHEVGDKIKCIVCGRIFKLVETEERYVWRG